MPRKDEQWNRCEYLAGKELKQAVEFCITADPKEKDMLFIIDIDNFKQIRDSQGHAC